MTAHAIRLRGFWTAAEAAPGRVRHSRNFGRPRTLDTGESVWLVGTAGTGRALVNDQPVGEIRGGEPFAFEITSVLQPRNVVAIEVRGDEPPGEVALEIRQ